MQIIEKIFIVSESQDTSTNKVVSYIQSLNFGFLRFNLGFKIEGFILNLGEIKFKIKSKTYKIDSKSRNSRWFRRGHLTYVFHSTFKSSIRLSISQHLATEWKVLSDILNEKYFSNSLGSYKKETENNILLDLLTAREVGLPIPDILVASQKNELQKFFEKYPQIISKPLRTHISFEFEDKSWTTNGAFIIKQSQIEIIKSDFFPTLFQEYINKEYEIRIFYLKGKCYSMAIFSQSDEKTKTDYRNYNREKPNRNVPYKLPADIEEKIILFMDKSGLDTGSIDMIKSTDGRYVFLEVNPSGQFDWLSVNCNYYIEKKIAHYLAYGNTEFD